MKIKRLIIYFLFLSITIFILIKYSSNDKSSVAVYLDNIESTTIPDRNSNYIVDKIVCDNGAIGTWDSIKWGISLESLNKKTNCKLYFKKQDTITIADTTIKIDEYSKCTRINDDGTVSITAPESNNSYLCKAPDDYGVSYYFRGNVTNNYVYFAGFYWRILRVNGDGSLRIIYDGTKAYDNGVISDERTVGETMFNSLEDDNAYIGYMYGTPGSSTYEKTHSNINSSTIKKAVDSWYENNIKDTKYEKYLTNNIFCNDRTINESDYIKALYPSYSNKGFGNEGTIYRWAKGPWNDSQSGNTDFVFYCKQQNDKLSVINNNLKYPIALITADELILSGIYRTSTSNNNFLCSSNNFWTMSASDYNSSGWAGVQAIEDCVFHSSGAFNVRAIGSIKPVINIDKGAITSGDGTNNNPFKLD